MTYAKKLLVLCVFFMCSFSAFAYDCVINYVGHCVWGVDPKNPDKLDLIDSKQFLNFCNKNTIYCSTSHDGHNFIVGRYLNNKVFLIAGQGWGGPDLILENKEQAERFAADFKTISSHSNTRFFVKNNTNPARRIIAVGYKEKADQEIEKIKLHLLANEFGATSDDYNYIPQDE